MTRTVTTKTVKRIITKGLIGREAGKLILQDFIYEYHGGDSVLSEADSAAIRNAANGKWWLRIFNHKGLQADANSPFDHSISC